MATVNRALYSCLAVAILVSDLSQAHAQANRPPDPAGLGPRAYFYLFSQLTVRKEIGLTVKQSKAIRPIEQEFRQEVREAVSNSLGSQVDEAEQKLQDKLKETTAKYRAKLKEQISPEQETRLEQIHWQFLGSVALLEDDVAKTLMISPEQQSKIRDAIKNSGLSRPRAAADSKSKQPPESFAERIKQRDKEVIDLLSPEQAKRFQELKGKEFDFATLN